MSQTTPNQYSGNSSKKNCVAIGFLITGKVLFLVGISCLIAQGTYLCYGYDHYYLEYDDTCRTLEIVGAVFTGIGGSLLVAAIIMFSKIRRARVIQRTYIAPTTIYPATSYPATVYPSQTTVVTYPGQTMQTIVPTVVAEPVYSQNQYAPQTQYGNYQNSQGLPETHTYPPKQY